MCVSMLDGTAQISQALLVFLFFLSVLNTRSSQFTYFKLSDSVKLSLCLKDVFANYRNFFHFLPFAFQFLYVILKLTHSFLDHIESMKASVKGNLY